MLVTAASLIRELERQKRERREGERGRETESRR
jgi:hypothetical protein